MWGMEQQASGGIGLPRRGRARATAGSSTVEAVKEYILEGGLAPGDPLPTEAALCEALGVSRSSVREAIRTLISLDIVEVQHGRGTTVGGMSLSPFVNGLVFKSLLNPDGRFTTLREVVALRKGIDLAAAEGLAGRLRGQPCEDLLALVEEMDARTAAGQEFMEADRAFHATLSGFMENGLVRQLVQALWEVHMVVVPQLGIQEPEDIDETVRAHRVMVESLQAGDTMAYRAGVSSHYAPLERSIERALLAQEGSSSTGG